MTKRLLQPGSRTQRGFGLPSSWHRVLSEVLFIFRFFHSIFLYQCVYLCQLYYFILMICILCAKPLGTTVGIFALTFWILQIPLLCATIYSDSFCLPEEKGIHETHDREEMAVVTKEFLLEYM